jgi:signal transduction histidine kinase
MRLSNSLRFRVALAFAIFGALLSILLSVGIYLTQHEMGLRLIDETLLAELDDSVSRHARNPSFIPPNTISIKGYVLSESEPFQNVPEEIRLLSSGKYDVVIEGVDYRVLVADRNGVRYFLLFDTDSQRDREEAFLSYLSFFALLMTIASAAGGFWLALRVISPVTRLAEQVAGADPRDTNLVLSKLARNDEVGELARTFDRYLRRLREFVERENYFTADVSHELRTPLAVVQGAVEVLEQDQTLSRRQRERLARIKRAVQDMADLTEALLLIARERQVSIDHQPCDAGMVARSCVDKHKHLIDGRPISLSVELHDEVYLNVERPLLEIVIGNLLRNAFNNTQSGSVALSLDAERLVLSDTGFGMSSEVLGRVFERHFKGASSIGAGVGLSLVKRICDRYGWNIAIESQQDKGTTVVITFATSVPAKF